ncbi:MAG: hypothetical protein ACM3PP_00940, partial [Candidatus Saccharibacteria bacterium]
MRSKSILIWLLALIVMFQSAAVAVGASTLQVAANPGKLSVSGQAGANAQISLAVTDQVYGSRKFLGQITADNNGSFSIDVPLEIGNYRVQATGAGINYETAASVSVNDDSTPNSGNGGSDQQNITVSLQVTGDSQRGVLLPRTFKT